MRKLHKSNKLKIALALPFMLVAWIFFVPYIIFSLAACLVGGKDVLDAMVEVHTEVMG